MDETESEIQDESKRKTIKIGNQAMTVVDQILSRKSVADNKRINYAENGKKNTNARLEVSEPRKNRKSITNGGHDRSNNSQAYLNVTS
jgi:hypothetical protein